MKVRTVPQSSLCEMPYLIVPKSETWSYSAILHMLLGWTLHLPLLWRQNVKAPFQQRFNIIAKLLLTHTQAHTPLSSWFGQMQLDSTEKTHSKFITFLHKVLLSFWLMIRTRTRSSTQQIKLKNFFRSIVLLDLTNNCYCQ